MSVLNKTPKTHSDMNMLKDKLVKFLSVRQRDTRDQLLIFSKKLKAQLEQDLRDVDEIIRILNQSL